MKLPRTYYDLRVLYLGSILHPRAFMREVRGVESRNAAGDVNPQCEFVIHKDEDVEIKAGDEVLVLISRPAEEGPEYGVALRILDKTEADENEILVQYGDIVFVGQKIPEFI
jgi:hypothetical protein